MKALKKTLVAVAATAMLSIGSIAHAGIVIDLFDGPAQSVVTSTLGATVNNQSAANANVVGLYRDLSITKTFDNVGTVNTGESSLASGGGVLQLDNATGNESLGVITWDGINDAGAAGALVDTTGLGGLDLTFGGANALLASIVAADLGFDYKIRVWDMAGNVSTLSAAVQLPVQPVDGVSADYQFSWFNLADGFYDIAGFQFTIAKTGIIDFSEIGALQLELSNADTISVDLAIGAIQTIPEPGTLALVGAALFGVAAVGRRRKA